MESVKHNGKVGARSIRLTASEWLLCLFVGPLFVGPRRRPLRGGFPSDWDRRHARG